MLFEFEIKIELPIIWLGSLLERLELVFCGTSFYILYFKDTAKS